MLATLLSLITDIMQLLYFLITFQPEARRDLKRLEGLMRYRN